MPRSLLIFLSIAVASVVVGLVFQKTHVANVKPSPQASASVPTIANEEMPSLTPLPGMSGSPSAEGQDGQGAPDTQISILQSQIEYLEQQNQALQEDNSRLIDQLATLRGGKPGTDAGPGSNPGMAPSPVAPLSCDPDVAAAEQNSSPDFAGIGIELLRLRGIKDIPIPTVEVAPAEVEKRIYTWLGTQFPADQGRKQGRALAALGAIPRPVDTIALKASFLTYQVGGWYDPSDSTLYLAKGVDGISGAAKENAMALSYGYLFKQKNVRLYPANQKPITLDARLGKDALLAGDASHLRFLHAIQNPAKGGGGGVGEDPDDPSRLVPIPNFLRELELLPFSVGLDFMQAMHSIGGWEQIDATYTRPPISSAEVLDSQVYLQETAFAPLPIEWPDTTVRSTPPLWNDTLGPFGVVLFLKQFIPEPVAAESLTGWMNDRLMVYENQQAGRDHVIWQTLWKDTNAADGFFSSLRTFLTNRHKEVDGSPTPATQPTQAPPGVFQLEHKGRLMRLKRTHSGNGVIFIDSADPTFAEEAFTKFAGS